MTNNLINITNGDRQIFTNEPEAEHVEQIELGECDDFGYSAWAIAEVMDPSYDLDGPDSMRLVLKIAAAFLDHHGEPRELPVGNVLAASAR